MDSQTSQLLKTIGDQLHHHIFPVVYNDGLVMPCETKVSLTKGKEKTHERQSSRRSATGARQRAATRERSSGQAASLVIPDIVRRHEQQLDELINAYPKTLVWKQPDGLIFLVESAVLEGLCTPARFIVVIPYDVNLIVKSWGFWGTSAISVNWIGPRHTNFPDGSICAFEPRDGTWKIGDSIIQLIDLYTVWALRHLFLSEFGYWPGPQSILWAYERVLEVQPDELCGCTNSQLKYRDCCQLKDNTINLVPEAITFLRVCHNGLRKPPLAISQFAINQNRPPEIASLYQSEIKNFRMAV